MNDLYQVGFTIEEIDNHEHYVIEPLSLIPVDEVDGVSESMDEDDSDYIVDEDNSMHDHEVDMTDFRLNIDLDVQDTNIDDLLVEDVLENDKFESGSDSDDNEIGERRHNLHILRRSNENIANFYIGQLFGTKEEGKKLIKTHSVETRRLIKIVKDDKQRVRAECHGSLPDFELDENGVHIASQQNKGKEKVVNVESKNVGGRGVKTNPHQYKCPWVLLISKEKNYESWIVKTLVTEHKCLPTREISTCTSTFLSEQMLEQVEENPEIPVKAVQEQFQRKYELPISRMKAYKARAKAKKQVEGDYISQYALLWDYGNELRIKNPGTTVKIAVEPGSNPSEPTRTFKRIYVCLGALKQGFKALGRDLLGLDGAFMKGPFPGQILTAVGIDPNNGIYPVCYAIVEAENFSSWSWFLQLLGDDLDLHGNSNFTFISDRQKGLLPAISRQFPCAEHRYYLRHVHENMKLSFRGKLYKDVLWKCATSTTIPEFETAMDKLKEFNKNAHLWLSKIPPKHWCRSHFSGRTVSIVLLNNMCEVYNAKIVEGRDKPIISALEYIREYLMRRIVSVLNVIDKSEGPLTPNATKMFEKIKKDATHYHVQWNGGDQYQVSGRPNKHCVVDLSKKTCDCRRWEITGMPCCHAVAAIWSMATNGQRVGALESWIHPVYTMVRWRHVYSFKINPINDRSLLIKTQIPITLTPPNHHNQVGRPKKARKRSAIEIEEITKDGRLSKKKTKAHVAGVGKKTIIRERARDRVPSRSIRMSFV